MLRPETIKFLEENIQANLLDIGLGNNFFWFDNKSKGKKPNKWDYIKQKPSLKQRKSTKWKGPLGNREKIFANYISNMGLISKIYKEFKELGCKKCITWLKIWQRTWIDIFPKKAYQWPTGMWRCETSLITREMQIKTIVRCHCTPVGTAIIRKRQ